MKIGSDFDSSAAKYVIRARIEIEGVVDKPDVVGAIFGQTEGLLGEDLDLRELQRTGRIGRIQIVIKSEGGMSKGEIVIPVSLDKTATAILAASLETVDRVGPCIAKISIEKLEDIRGAKRRRVVSRAISILKGWEEEIAPGSEEITSAVTTGSRKQIVKFGPDKLPSGPELTSSDEIIIVEGRADVVNLMKSGIENTVAVEGTHVPKSISDLTRKRGKTIIAFLDGDRGGDLILRELMQVAKVDYIARAPEGKEVEELSRREVMKALQAKIPADQALALVSAKSQSSQTRQRKPSKRPTRGKRDEQERSEPQDRRRSRRPPPPSTPSGPSIDQEYVAKIGEVREAFKAILFDENKKVIKQCGVAELAKTLEELDKVHGVVFDGVVTQRLVDIAGKKGTHLIIGAAVADIENRPATMLIRTFDDVT
jgi:DNA primase